MVGTSTDLMLDGIRVPAASVALIWVMATGYARDENRQLLARLRADRER